jgi:ABC-type glycerol-3-phosphate transport system permease component
MPLIPQCGRRSLKLRLVIIGLYAVLSLGAVSMVYPFLLMLGTSVTSGSDSASYRIVPKYIYDDSALFPKYAEDRYAGDIEQINALYGTAFPAIMDITAPNIDIKAKGVAEQVRDYDQFVKALPPVYKQAGFQGYLQSPSRLLDEYKAFCRKRFGNDITKLNKAYLDENPSFETLTLPFERYKLREWMPEKTTKMQEWLQFKAKLPAFFLYPMMVDPSYAGFLRDGVYENSIDNLNKAWGTKYKDFSQIHFAGSVPSDPRQRGDWEKFVRESLPFRYMRIDPAANALYRNFLSNRYKGNISELNDRYQSSYASFAEIALPKEIPQAGSPQIDYMDFVAKQIPIGFIKPVNTENLYREHLQAKYGSIDGVNKAFGTKYASLLDVSPPAYASDYAFVLRHAKDLRHYFLTRNYRVVLDYIVLHGTAVRNTAIYVCALILVALIINPMCAYALSRYNLPYAYKVLLFLLATMAFPAEVAMIPSFLLLKNLHLLNTFWALILPGMANGYAIFLLKGFFDSLPKELYEAGIIDGASEGTMFRKITIPMSKPIFAVIALQSFTHAYGAFMYAMLVCQDQKMWTIMVWLYQLQISAPQYITMAALVVTAIPTLIVFILAQNVIMRGIIIPTFK